MTSINIYANLTRVSRIFSLFQLCIGWAERELQENFEKDAPFYRSLCIDLPPPLRFSLRGGGGEGRNKGYFMRETRNYRKLWILSWIPKLWILSRRLLSRIVAISTTIFSFLPCLLLNISIVFLPPPPLPHFHCFPSTTTSLCRVFRWSSTWKTKKGKSKLLFPPPW